MESVSQLNHDTIDGIQGLIEINIDSSKGFAEAADKIENPGVASLFRQCAAERSEFADELKNLIRMNGIEPREDGTLKGAVHRWWQGIRGTVAGGDEHTVLADAERGEDTIKHEYESTLRKTAGSAVNDILSHQYARVKSRHDQIRDMRDARA